MTGELEFSTDDVVIADNGSVLIKNVAFAKALVGHMKRLNPEVGIFDNCDCKKVPRGELALRDLVPAAHLRLDPGSAGIFDNCNCGK